MKKSDNYFYMLLTVIDCMNAMIENDFEELNFHKFRLINFYNYEFKAIYIFRQFPWLLEKFNRTSLLSRDFYKTIRYLASIVFWQEYTIKFCIE